jgi:hypothetical protein
MRVDARDAHLIGGPVRRGAVFSSAITLKSLGERQTNLLSAECEPEQLSRRAGAL